MKEPACRRLDRFTSPVIACKQGLSVGGDVGSLVHNDGELYDVETKVIAVVPEIAVPTLVAASMPAGADLFDFVKLVDDFC